MTVIRSIPVTELGLLSPEGLCYFAYTGAQEQVKTRQRKTWYLGAKVDVFSGEEMWTLKSLVAEFQSLRTN